MIKGGAGGNQTKSGLFFEKGKSLIDVIHSSSGYSIKLNAIYFNNKIVAYNYRKYALYKFLAKNGINWNTHISKRLLPDDALYIIISNILFIIEIKFQSVAGSVDEKLQTCDFKKKQFKKLLSPLNIDVEYIYILNDWFKKPEYKDALDYIISVGCSYYFNYIPLNKLGLPISE